MKGWRTIILAAIYFAWLGVMGWIFRPPEGFTPDLLAAFSSFAGATGLVATGFAGLRVAKSYSLAKHGAKDDPA